MQATQLVVSATQAASTPSPSTSGGGGGSGGGGRSRKQVFVKAESEKKEAVKEGKDGSVERELNVSKVSVRIILGRPTAYRGRFLVNEFRSSKLDICRISLAAGSKL